MTEATPKLAAALSAFQAALPDVPKNATGEVKKEGRTVYTWQYADLADCVQMVRRCSSTNRGVGAMDQPAKGPNSGSDQGASKCVSRVTCKVPSCGSKGEM